MPAEDATPPQPSNYERYRQAPFNRPEFYPVRQSVSSDYRPLAPWMGRLILPQLDRRDAVRGALFEVYHAPDDFQDLVGQVVIVRLSDKPEVRSYVQKVTQDVHLSPQARESIQEGRVHPTRLEGWQAVDPLESLAGSHPVDDVVVMLSDPVAVQRSQPTSEIILFVDREPVQITGRSYGLVQFVAPVAPDSELFGVVHFDSASGQFAGATETVRMPPVVADANQNYPSTTRAIETSPLNETGWYIYGAADESGTFTVQAIAPRALLRVQPDRVIVGEEAVQQYLKKETWSDIAEQKGTISSVLLSASDGEGVQTWSEGQRALLIHVYGGIGGEKTEPAARAPLYFGHFSYGVATVVREPLADELRFEIVYHQIYTHNHEGVISGSLHWSRYMGDRQFGWLGLRPIADMLISLDAFTGNYQTEDGWQGSPLDLVVAQLEIMAARYRIGDGTGGTFVVPSNNCNQDANQALYRSLRRLGRVVRVHPQLQKWMQENPDRRDRLEQLEQLRSDLKKILIPWGKRRKDWKYLIEDLGNTLAEKPLQNLIRSVLSWRTILPRSTSEEVTEVFLERGASVWVLRANQVGGIDPDVEPVAPMTL